MPISQVLEGACGSPEGGLGQNLACKGKRAKPQAHAGAGAGRRTCRDSSPCPGMQAHACLHTALSSHWCLGALWGTPLVSL